MRRELFERRRASVKELKRTRLDLSLPTARNSIGAPCRGPRR